MKNKRFPLIAESVNIKCGDFTVCFTSLTEGVVIECCPSTNLFVGEVSENWVYCFNEDYWRIITQPSEYPKEMYVSGASNENAIQQKDKKMIVAYLEKHDRYICENGYNWAFAVDTNAISERQAQINDILAQINELQEKVNELLSK